MDGIAIYISCFFLEFFFFFRVKYHLILFLAIGGNMDVYQVDQ